MIRACERRDVPHDRRMSDPLPRLRLRIRFGGDDFIGGDGENVLDLGAARLVPQRNEAAALHVAAEQSADARAGNAKRMALLRLIGENEGIAEQATHRLRLERAALGRRSEAAHLVPIGKKTSGRWMLHSEPD